MKAEVITVSSYDPKPAYYRPNAFRASVRRFGVEPTILGHNVPWKGLMTKPRLYREFLRKGHASGDVLIVCDAWDVFFAAHPDEVVDRWQQLGRKDHVVFNAERNCFPCTELTKTSFDVIADEHKVMTPWRYLNSGFMVGAPANILTLLESLNLDAIPDDHQLPDGSWFNPNDQAYFQMHFIRVPQIVPMNLDYRTELCIAAHGSALDEFDWSTPKPTNLITGTTPLVWHCNGSAKNDIAPALLKHLGLPER